MVIRVRIGTDQNGVRTGSDNDRIRFYTLMSNTEATGEESVGDPMVMWRDIMIKLDTLHLHLK